MQLLPRGVNFFYSCFCIAFLFFRALWIIRLLHYPFVNLIEGSFYAGQLITSWPFDLIEVIGQPHLPAQTVQGNIYLHPLQGASFGKYSLKNVYRLISTFMFWMRKKFFSWTFKKISIILLRLFSHLATLLVVWALKKGTWWWNIYCSKNPKKYSLLVWMLT